MKKLLAFLFPFILITIFSISCGKIFLTDGIDSEKLQLLSMNSSEELQPEPDSSRCFVLSQSGSEIRFDTIYNYSDSADLAYIMPYDGRIDPFSKNHSIYYRKEIKTEIIIDSTIGEKIPLQTLQFVDTILQKLYMGIKLIVEDTSRFADLSKIVTYDTLNTENIVRMLDKEKYIDTTKELHIYLFEHSEFFNTSNAFALSSGKHKFIFGNKDLFNSSLLFVHELGHAYGLSHYNKPNLACNNGDTIAPFMNIMHESFIGCAVLFSPQQCLLMSHREFIDNDSATLNLFPLRPDTFDCGCNTAYYQSEFDKFLYSKDRSIHEEPVVGQYELLNSDEFYDTSAYKTFRKNFRTASKFLFDSPDDQKAFIDQSIEGVDNLRKDNFIRLFGENLIRKGKRDSVDWKVFFTDGIDKYFDYYRDSVTTNPLMSTSKCKQDSLENVIDTLETDIENLTEDVNFWQSEHAKITTQLGACRSELVSCESDFAYCQNQLKRCQYQKRKCQRQKDICESDLFTCEENLKRCLKCDEAAIIIRNQLKEQDGIANNEAFISDFIESFKARCMKGG